MTHEVVIMSVFLNNLDDFILPSQGCINPFVLNKTADGPVKLAPTKITLQSDFSTSEFERPKKPDLIKTKISSASSGQKVAAVSLNDCLACSGCVTSAESVLIEEQSYHKLLDKISIRTNIEEDIIVVCLSPQSVASMAAFAGTSSSRMFLRIASALKLLGVKYVLDTSSAGDVALIESREEFMMRYRNGKKALWEKPPHTVSASSTSVYLIPENIPGNKANKVNSTGKKVSLFGADLNDLVSTGRSSSVAANMSNSNQDVSQDNELLHVGDPINGDQTLPMLASQCPGWVCYAEKTQPQSLPYISHTKSPQQILGSILKYLIFKQETTAIPIPLSTPSSSSSSSSSSFSSPYPSAASSSSVKSVYVVSVQPCFDKKLESSRKDFYHTDTDNQEVDLVISTTELWSLIEMQAVKHIENISKESTSTSTSTSTSIITSELSAVEYLENINPDLPYGCDEIESLFRSYSTDGRTLVSSADANNGSGGYLEHIFRFAAEKLSGVNLWGQSLQYTQGRNIDVSEVSLSNQIITQAQAQAQGTGTGTNSDIKLKFGKAYGFRNIQSVMLKMKQGKCDLDFIEIMACPSGCINGGGQLKVVEVAPSGEVLRESMSATAVRVRAVDEAIHCTVVRRPEDSPLVKYLYSSCSYEDEGNVPQSSSSHLSNTDKNDDKNDTAVVEMDVEVIMSESHTALIRKGVLGRPLSSLAMSLLHTRYHSVPKLELLAPLAVKW